MNDDNRPDTINMLLDIEKFSGEHSGRMMPIIIFLVLAGLPPLIVVYYFIGRINISWFILPYIIYVARLAMIILGKERLRVENYKRQLHDVYSSTYDLFNIKTIHDDGCIEYTNGTVAYCFVGSNGDSMDEIVRAQIVRRFLVDLNREFTTDIYVQNISNSIDLSNRYDGVKLFNDGEVAKDFISLIDHNRELIYNKSLISRVVFVVKGRRKDFKLMKESIETTSSSSEAKIFKTLELADKDLARSIISRDIDTYIDYEEIVQKKYRTGQYLDSEVIGYDLVEKEVEEHVEIERGFMVRE